jgi:hypothetical protein
MRVDWVVNDVVSVGCDVGYWVLGWFCGVFVFGGVPFGFCVVCVTVFVFVDLAGM